MERTIPRPESEEVDLYTRTYYSLLRSTAEIQIRSLEEVHAGTNSLLHPDARHLKLDMSAFTYCQLRLPACMPQVQLVVLGQSPEMFMTEGFGDVYTWQEVSAAARRRRTFFNGAGVLACLVTSRSDIDDVIPLMTAYQIEWNKLHMALNRLPVGRLDQALEDEAVVDKVLSEAVDISPDDIRRLHTLWGQDFNRSIKLTASRPCRLRLRLLSGSLSAYRRVTHAWWAQIEEAVPDLHRRPIYFISSNTHSVLNTLSGFVLRNHVELLGHLGDRPDEDLLIEWQSIQAGELPSSRENFLYYLYKKIAAGPAGSDLRQRQLDDAMALGISLIRSRRYLDLEVQVFDLARLDPSAFDPRLAFPGLEQLKRSQALLVNIDYPLGLAAYNVLTEVSEWVGSVLGVYLMGKAATLNGIIGDVMIPNVVYDAHSKNTYLFPNCFCATDVSPYLVYSSVLDNQKAVTVQGTFLQNVQYMDVFYREGYTDIEMEAGPYLSAVYEMYRPTRHPVNEIVNLYGLPFDLGILHYASDTPLSKGKNLGAASLSYYGMDSTYATTIAILRRVLQMEVMRLGS
jgi:hypothetical protein